MKKLSVDRGDVPSSPTFILQSEPPGVGHFQLLLYGLNPTDDINSWVAGVGEQPHTLEEATQWADLHEISKSFLLETVPQWSPEDRQERSNENITARWRKEGVFFLIRLRIEYKKCPQRIRVIDVRMAVNLSTGDSVFLVRKLAEDQEDKVRKGSHKKSVRPPRAAYDGNVTVMPVRGLSVIHTKIYNVGADQIYDTITTSKNTSKRQRGKHRDREGQASTSLPGQPLVIVQDAILPNPRTVDLEPLLPLYPASQNVPMSSTPSEDHRKLAHYRSAVPNVRASNGGSQSDPMSDDLYDPEPKYEFSNVNRHSSLPAPARSPEKSRSLSTIAEDEGELENRSATQSTNQTVSTDARSSFELDTNETRKRPNGSQEEQPIIKVNTDELSEQLLGSGNEPGDVPFWELSIVKEQEIAYDPPRPHDSFRAFTWLAFDQFQVWLNQRLTRIREYYGPEGPLAPGTTRVRWTCVGYLTSF